MIVYDNTEFHNGINLKGTDIEQGKFPRIDRDGLFVDEVRSNPTTGLLEIWDGTQWLGYIMEPMPTGSINETMRYGQNGWQSTPAVLVSELPETQVLVNHRTLPTLRYAEITVGDVVTTLRVASDSTNKYASLSSGGTNVRLMLQRTSSSYVLSSATETDSYMKIVASSSNSQLNFTNTPAYTPTANIISYGTHFSIAQNGKVKSEYLSGTGSALVEALEDGTMQRSTISMPKTKIINRVLAWEEGLIGFSNTDLGIAGDLTTKIISFEILGDVSGTGIFASELPLRHKLVSSSDIVFSFNPVIPAGTNLRLAITYID